MLLATWLALGRGVIRPLLAGAALGFGIWYVRSAAAVVPAVALACMWQGRKRAVAWFAGGLLLLPALVLVNALVLADAGRAGLGTLLVESVSGMRRDGVDLPALPAKAGESLSVPSATTLFAPVITDWWAPSRGLSWFASCVGVLWVAGWALGLLLAMVRLPRRLRGPTRNLPAVAVGLLPLGCAAAYVFGPFRIEHGNRGWTPLEWAQAPNVTDVRYVVPILLMWTALVSLELAEPRSWRPVHYLEWVAAGLLVLGGSLNAVIGARVDRAPAGSFMATGVVRYGFLYGPHRGPSRESHATCSTGDPISRAAHLRALGAFAQPSPWTVRDDPRAVRRRLLEVKQELGLTNSELAFVAEGVGMALADQLASTAQIDLWELVRWLESSANELDCGLSAPFSLGVATFLQNAFASAWVESDELTPLLCTGAGERARPFCFMAGSLLDLRDDMDASAMVSENPLAGDPVIERALMRGLGVNTGSVRPPGLWPQAENLTHWPVDHREAFLDGLRTGGRRRWRFEATPEFRPDRMP